MHSFFILALISVQWVLWGYSLAFGAGGAASSAGSTGSGCAASAQEPNADYAATIPALVVHGLPDDVRHHHPGADHRRLRRAQALQGVRHLQPALGDPRLRPGGALGLGRRRLAARATARSTSPAAPSSTSPRASRRWSRPACSASASASAGVDGAAQPDLRRCSAPGCSGSAGSGSTPAAPSAPTAWPPTRFVVTNTAAAMGGLDLDDRLLAAPRAPQRARRWRPARSPGWSPSPRPPGSSIPASAILIGLGAGVFCFFAVDLLKRNVGVDDALDVFAVHGVGGIWGALATGLFATTAVNPAGADGLFYGNPEQLLKQAVAVVAVVGVHRGRDLDHPQGRRRHRRPAGAGAGGGARPRHDDARRGGVPAVASRGVGSREVRQVGATPASPGSREGGETEEETTWT